ncbi:GrpB family protein [Synechococcus elongatus]|uniref:GrpB family protein n=1 Tax=Synechococcus elongatus TaxID=32046 RepID=UPI0030CF1239
MKITLEPYTPAWKEQFQQQRSRINQAIAPLNPVIEHIGSTGIGNIVAKPIIDILVGLRESQLLDATIAPMLAAGYTYVEAFNQAMPYRRFYVQLKAISDAELPTILKPDQPLAFGQDYLSTVNIHVITYGTYHWVRHVAFRDYLIAHPEMREAYQALKRRIVAIDFEDLLDYNGHKEAFILEVQAKAIAWFLEQPENEIFRAAIAQHSSTSASTSR